MAENPGGRGCCPALSPRTADLGRGDRFRVEHPELGQEPPRRWLLCAVLGFTGKDRLEADRQRSRVVTRCPGVKETPQGVEGEN